MAREHPSLYPSSGNGLKNLTDTIGISKTRKPCLEPKDAIYGWALVNHEQKIIGYFTTMPKLDKRSRKNN